MRKQRIWQAAAYALCAAIALARLDIVGASEFRGGQVTGPLFAMAAAGCFLFILAVVLTFLVPRIASVIAFTAALLSLPMYLFLIEAVPFRRVFKGEYTVPAVGFVWDNWALAEITCLLLACVVSFRSLFATNKPKPLFLKAETKD